ncbi:unnamed protein product [Polarella glacialis]|uniref:Uncharacterized protein n=1 Tax=Polarella glacialis TaxID=89957 RepID=A0A813K904_POLGL|nr:unnamed protein product [Polarella glacialis]
MPANEDYGSYFHTISSAIQDDERRRGRCNKRGGADVNPSDMKAGLPTIIAGNVPTGGRSVPIGLSDLAGTFDAAKQNRGGTFLPTVMTGRQDQSSEMSSGWRALDHNSDAMAQVQPSVSLQQRFSAGFAEPSQFQDSPVITGRRNGGFHDFSSCAARAPRHGCESANMASTWRDLSSSAATHSESTTTHLRRSAGSLPHLATLRDCGMDSDVLAPIRHAACDLLAAASELTRLQFQEIQLWDRPGGPLQAELPKVQNQHSLKQGSELLIQRLPWEISDPCHHQQVTISPHASSSVRNSPSTAQRAGNKWQTIGGWNLNNQLERSSEQQTQRQDSGPWEHTQQQQHRKYSQYQGQQQQQEKQDRQEQQEQHAQPDQQMQHEQQEKHEEQRLENQRVKHLQQEQQFRPQQQHQKPRELDSDQQKQLCQQHQLDQLHVHEEVGVIYPESSQTTPSGPRTRPENQSPAPRSPFPGLGPPSPRALEEAVRLIGIQIQAASAAANKLYAVSSVPEATKVPASVGSVPWTSPEAAAVPSSGCDGIARALSETTPLAEPAAQPRLTRKEAGGSPDIGRGAGVAVGQRHWPCERSEWHDLRLTGSSSLPSLR